MFAGDPAPFVMELPAYHWPTWATCLRSHVGARLVLHQEGRYHHPAFHHLCVVHHLLRLVDGHSGMLGEDRSTAPSWPRSAARSPGSLHLSAGATGRRPLLPSPAWLPRRTSLVRWVFSTAAATVGTVSDAGAGLHRYHRLQLPGVQPAVRSLLRRHRRHQARDEQPSGPGSPSAISAVCLYAWYICGGLNVIGLIFAVAVFAFMIYMLVRPYKEATTLKVKPAKK